MALRKIIKNGYTIKSGYTKTGGYRVGIPIEALDGCDLDSGASVKRRIAEFLLAADIPERFCTKKQIHKYAHG